MAERPCYLTAAENDVHTNAPMPMRQIGGDLL